MDVSDSLSMLRIQGKAPVISGDGDLFLYAARFKRSFGKETIVAALATADMDLGPNDRPYEWKYHHLHRTAIKPQEVADRLHDLLFWFLKK